MKEIIYLDILADFYNVSEYEIIISNFVNIQHNHFNHGISIFGKNSNYIPYMEL